MDAAWVRIAGAYIPLDQELTEPWAVPAHVGADCIRAATAEPRLLYYTSQLCGIAGDFRELVACP